MSPETYIYIYIYNLCTEQSIGNRWEWLESSLLAGSCRFRDVWLCLHWSMGLIWCLMMSWGCSSSFSGAYSAFLIENNKLLVLLSCGLTIYLEIDIHVFFYRSKFLFPGQPGHHALQFFKGAWGKVRMPEETPSYKPPGWNRRNRLHNIYMLPLQASVQTQNIFFPSWLHTS